MVTRRPVALSSTLSCAPRLHGQLLVALAAALLVPRQALAQKMYWTDYVADQIRRANLDGTSVEDLITTGLSTNRYLAVDSAGGKIYWTDNTVDKIRRADLDGTGVEDLVTAGIPDGRGIALDVAGGKMYWADKADRMIRRANLDGTGAEDLLATEAGSDPRENLYEYIKLIKFFLK